MTDASPRNEEHPLAVLIRVQDLDTAISQHEHRRAALPERRELAELNARGAAVRRRTAELDERGAELAGGLAHLEEQTTAVVARRRALEDRLSGARGAAGRDLAAIESEIGQLRSRLGQLEDEEIVLLEEQEPLEAERDAHRAELAELAERAAELTRRIAEADAEIDGELVSLRAARGDQAALLPEALARRYEDLRARLGGTGAARLIGDRCDGCHLTLPSAEVDRIRHLPPDAVATCEQCGRILVRASLGGDA